MGRLRNRNRAPPRNLQGKAARSVCGRRGQDACLGAFGVSILGSGHAEPLRPWPVLAALGWHRGIGLPERLTLGTLTAREPETLT